MKAAPGDGPAKVVAEGSRATCRFYLGEPEQPRLGSDAKELPGHSLVQER